MKGVTLGGMSPPLTFTAGQAHTIDCWFVSHTSGGTSALANNGQVQCEPGKS
jgi:branched-chain amino acid transport system substrate-binding protein